jgi:hypothetical protein
MSIKSYAVFFLVALNACGDSPAPVEDSGPTTDLTVAQCAGHTCECGGCIYHGEPGSMYWDGCAAPNSLCTIVQPDSGSK